jgi:hypothetical protein
LKHGIKIQKRKEKKRKEKKKKRRKDLGLGLLPGVGPLGQFTRASPAKPHSSAPSLR